MDSYERRAWMGDECAIGLMPILSKWPTAKEEPICIIWVAFSLAGFSSEREWDTYLKQMKLHTMLMKAQRRQKPAATSAKIQSEDSSREYRGQGQNAAAWQRKKLKRSSASGGSVKFMSYPLPILHACPTNTSQHCADHVNFFPLSLHASYSMV